KVVGVLDNDPRKIGQRLEGIEIASVSRLADIVAANQAEIGIIAVPADEAQEVANSMVQAGIRAILNFSPRVLVVPDEIVVRNVDLSVNLEILSFYLGAQKR
ncbi:MAG: redox-sensing transcriptional repressor Rex, partial [Syntrophomonadaceae bacterium]|nr:redox-sensing transcriptional repressor Rex [Syntrophomonadaceae bacterium]